MQKYIMGKSMLGFPFFLALFFLPSLAFSQTTEIGFGAGILTYSGDLNRSIDLSVSQPAAQVFHRVNINRNVSFKTALTAGKLKGRDKSSFDVFAANRNASFDIFVFEVSGTFEYHFLYWRSEKSNLRWSPYFLGGLGLLNMAGHKNQAGDYSKIQAVLPLGFGFKYIINPRWYVGVEGSGRVTFFDYLDNVSSSSTNSKNYQNGFTDDNDKYYYIGFSLNYSFYEIPCPFSYK